MDAATAAQLRGQAGALGVSLSKEVSERLVRYLEELGRWGRRMNLTASLEPPRLLEHMLDCLPLLAEIPQAARCVDVGSGGGFPGLVLACCRPDLDLTLVESVGKKATFLRHAARTVGLGKVRVENRRAETLVPGQFDVAVSRAALPPEAWLALGRQLVRPGGRVIAMLQGDAPTPDRCRRVDYQLPISGARHALAVLDL